jgi:hypothetical protein
MWFAVQLGLLKAELTTNGIVHSSYNARGRTESVAAYGTNNLKPKPNPFASRNVT